MNAQPTASIELSTLQDTFNQQKISFSQTAITSRQKRIRQLLALKKALLSHQNALVSALNQDYGHRPTQDSLIADIMPCVLNINYTVKQLKKWMRPERRHSGLLFAPAKVTIHYQPLGIIGIMVPWNFPVMLSIGPLITALAAGNSAMIKLSEFTPNTNQVIKKIIQHVFNEKNVAVVEGEADIAAAFSKLKFDHLLFTGSTNVGRHVMHAAADNLTPVTLELGGKSPVIIAEDMPIKIAVERLIFGKCINAGQICVAPDYIFCPENKISEFIQAYQEKFKKMYGKHGNSSDYTNIINDNQHKRLLIWLEDAISKGAKVDAANGLAIDPASRQLATQLVTQVSDDMQIMKEEIFGPILPIIPYNNLTETIDYINKRPKPLALYIMSFDEKIQQQLLQQTQSGGVCINETILHAALDDAPFGGIGDSGMGHYHGKEGFLSFSKAKTVLKSGKYSASHLIHPPYNKWLTSVLLKIFLR